MAAMAEMAERVEAMATAARVAARVVARVAVEKEVEVLVPGAPGKLHPRY